ncbi:hypothetical protein TNCV_1892181 [Trichonephila clavipes]|nr:hypothetical protein TNCV_1892181 [Trichonephila clavipes]
MEDFMATDRYCFSCNITSTRDLFERVRQYFVTHWCPAVATDFPRSQFLETISTGDLINDVFALLTTRRDAMFRVVNVA